MHIREVGSMKIRYEGEPETVNTTDRIVPEIKFLNPEKIGMSVRCTDLPFIPLRFLPYRQKDFR